MGAQPCRTVNECRLECTEVVADEGQAKHCFAGDEFIDVVHQVDYTNALSDCASEWNDSSSVPTFTGGVTTYSGAEEFHGPPLFELPELSRHRPAAPQSARQASGSAMGGKTPSRSRIVVDKLMFDELHLDYKFFNPCTEPLKTQLMQKLVLQPDFHVDPIKQQMGACNAGMWILHDGSQQFMLKLVRIMPEFMGPCRSPESEKFAKLAVEHPEMVRDPSLAFPCKIFRCHGKGGNSKTHDLIVMPWAPGIRFADYIMHKLHAKEMQHLMRVLELFGSFLADFHQRYDGLQHGDLTPANIFFDERDSDLESKFTLADVSDIAPRNPVIQADTDRFVSGLKLLANFFGEDLWTQGKARFETGYKKREHMQTRWNKSLEHVGNAFPMRGSTI